MAATILKAANLHSLKFMFGVGEATPRDAASDVGCVSVNGGSMPINGHGSITIGKPDEELTSAATAVLRLPWKPSTRQGIQLASLCRISRGFTGRCFQVI